MEATEEKRAQLEKDVQEALIREEALKHTVARLQKELDQCQKRAQETKTQLINAAREADNDFNQKINNLKLAAEDATKKHADELLQLRNGLEKRMQQALQALQTAKDDEIEKQQERLDALQTHIESLIQQHEEALIRAENEKQQALLIGRLGESIKRIIFLLFYEFFFSAHRDKQAVQEKLETISRELKNEQDALERAKREHNARDEKQRNSLAQLKDELVALRTKEEEQK